MQTARLTIWQAPQATTLSYELRLTFLSQSRESSPEAPASKAHLYPSSKPLPPTTSTARAPAILVAATPSPAAASLAAAAQSDSMDEDDPILDVSQRTQAEAIFPFYWTPQDTITSETGGKSESAPKDPPLPPSKQQQQGTPKQPPVTMVDRKGKGEGVVDGTELSARDTSSKKVRLPSFFLPFLPSADPLSARSTPTLPLHSPTSTCTTARSRVPRRASAARVIWTTTRAILRVRAARGRRR